jgi:hypothetical protein
MTILNAAAVLLFASCRNDRSAETKATEAQTREQSRTVFGSDPKPGASDTRAREAAPLVNDSERARVSRAASAESGRRSVVGDPGEGVGRDRRVVASGSAPRQPAAERFLHYRPPGSRVGDPGELAASQSRAPISVNRIRELVRRWADTLLAGNLDAHMSLYVPNVDRSVRASRRTLVRALAGTRRFEIYDLKLRTLADGSVLSEFRIESDAAGRRSYRLHWRQIGSDWKIYREESSAVQRISRSRSN